MKATSLLGLECSDYSCKTLFIVVIILFIFSLTIPYEPSNGLDMNSVTDGTVFSCSDEGVTVKLPNNCSGFCFSNQAAGKGVTATISNLKEKFPIGKRVACKPVAYNNVDNVFIVIFNVSAESPSDQVRLYFCFSVIAECNNIILRIYHC